MDDVDQKAAIQVATLARAAGATVTSDINRVTDRTEELVAAVSIPILAEHVPTALTGEAEVGRALRILHERHGTLMCVTLGRSGAMIVDGGRLHYSPAFAVDAVDTTGAGDVFRGAFIYGLLKGDDAAGSPAVCQRRRRRQLHPARRDERGADTAGRQQDDGEVTPVVSRQSSVSQSVSRQSSVGGSTRSTLASHGLTTATHD